MSKCLEFPLFLRCFSHPISSHDRALIRKQTTQKISTNKEEKRFQEDIRCMFTYDVCQCNVTMIAQKGRRNEKQRKVKNVTNRADKEAEEKKFSKKNNINNILLSQGSERITILRQPQAASINLGNSLVEGIYVN
ncbi:CLUMA_CG008335, isoform A [Clunio marinus]|uniref:CLUMA_CG008335, isoform A n=1 Tax=Clunio marinus TaxID=568069 RepID=A0A1J1I3R9_9DIPT|nr:CLUMA_CG008335, isoform A [Clunio marinus]